MSDTGSKVLLILSSIISTLTNYRSSTNWPPPEPCVGNCSYIHDPSVVQRASDGKYFRFSTNGNIAIASAPQMTGPWTYEGAMLPNNSIIKLATDQELWCPDVSLIEDTYYAYYAVSTVGSQNSDIGVATSKSLDPASWTDHGTIGIPKNTAYNRIDPNLFRESSTSPFYMSFGSAWKEIYQLELDNPPVDSVGDSSPNQLIYNSTKPTSKLANGVVEGSFQFWWPVNNTKYYYMFFSSGSCCNAKNALAPPGEEYKIMVCRANEVTGPFFDKTGKNCLTDSGGTLVLGSHDDLYAPGGQGVIYNNDLGRPVMYYHYVNKSVGYDYEDFQFGSNYLDFSSGWPIVVK